MAFFDKLTGAALRLLIREIREVKGLLRDWTDTYRVVNGLDPLYSKRDIVADAPRGGDQPAIRAGDFLSVWCIEELAREFAVPVDTETDLERLAVDRGWMTLDGKFLMLPGTAAAYLGEEAVGVLMGEPK